LTENKPGYDLVAEDYAGQFANELDQKPFDRDMLERLVQRTQPGGVVADLGCGPAHAAAWFHQRGFKALGIDASQGMLAEGHKLFPFLELKQGDIARLREPDASWDAALAAYSLIHIPADTMVEALKGIHRCLKPKATLLLSFHLGQHILRRREWFGKEVDIDFHFFTKEQMQEWLRNSGFEVSETWVREPYPQIEFQSHRAYIFAKAV